jgi:hypothetical protein
LDLKFAGHDLQLVRRTDVFLVVQEPGFGGIRTAEPGGKLKALGPQALGAGTGYQTASSLSAGELSQANLRGSKASP